MILVLLEHVEISALSDLAYLEIPSSCGGLEYCRKFSTIPPGGKSKEDGRVVKEAPRDSHKTSVITGRDWNFCVMYRIWTCVVVDD